MQTNLTISEAFRILARANFRPFDDYDWEAFSGCESGNPLIAPEHLHAGQIYTIIVDGDKVNFILEGDEFGGQLFTMKGI